MDADVERTAIASPDGRHRSLAGMVSRLAEHAATIGLFAVFCVAVTPIGIVRSCLGRSAIEPGRAWTRSVIGRSGGLATPHT